MGGLWGEYGVRGGGLGEGGGKGVGGGWVVFCPMQDIGQPYGLGAAGKPTSVLN